MPYGSLNTEGGSCNCWTHINWSYHEAWPVRWRFL